MARDYAKKDRPVRPGAASTRKPANSKKRQATTGPRKRTPAGAQHGALSVKWILSLAAVGGFVGFVVYLNALPAPQGASQQAEEREPVTARAPETAAEPKPQPKQQERNFRFYDMLPESEVVPPEVQEYSPNPSRQDINYIVQSGSFRKMEDAERQRAQIAFQGLRAQIQQINLDSGSVWYRVNVGPFESRSQMNAAVDKLVSINIQPLVRKIPKEG